MEEQYDVEEIEFRKTKLIELLQENVYDYVNAIDKEDYIINIYVQEFWSQSLELESMAALKLILEEMLEEYEMDIDSVFYKINVILSNITEHVNHLAVSNENTGFIYLMMNPSMPGIIKIGFTKRTPEERLDELSKATGVPIPFVLVYKEEFNNCIQAEKVIHALLEERGERVASNREFFKTEIHEAIKIIQQVKADYDFPLKDPLEQVYDWNDEKSISKDYLEKGLDYLNGYGEYLQDFDKGIEYLEKAGELGEARAYYELGNFLLDASSNEDKYSLDIKKAIKYFEEGRNLTGKYANYCNAGLALCYVNKYLPFYKVRNYKKNEANAEKCWQWFFNNLDFNDSDYLATIHIMNFFDHFMFNEEVFEAYKKSLENIILSVIPKCRYDLYEHSVDFSLRDDIKQYLLTKFEKNQLERTVKIDWLRDDDFFNNDGENFKIQLIEGYIDKNDIVSFNGNGGAFRKVKEIIKNEYSVEKLLIGDGGILVVDNVLEDFDGYMIDTSSISIIGSTVLEQNKETDQKKIEIPLETAEKKGVFNKIRGWFE